MSVRTLVLLITAFFCVAGALDARAQSVMERFTTVGAQYQPTRFQNEFSEPVRGPAAEERYIKSIREQDEDSAPEPQRYGQAFAEREIKSDLSTLEEMYSTRIVDHLDQFGYDLFGVPSLDTQRQISLLGEQPNTPSGAVQDDFILGSGDELEVMFTGQRNDRNLYTVNDQGLLLIQDFPPIPAAGRSIGQVRLSIQSAADSLYNTEAFVSLSSVRQIGVLVIGHVKRPGKKTLTVFHTVLDALMQAGGVQKDGSLRQIKLVRDGRSTIIDIYGLLMHGNTNMDLALRDGDRILIPSIGPTVAVAGEVKRPGIYEILPELNGMHAKPGMRSEKLSLNEMLELGGGVLAPGKNRHLKLAVTEHGSETVNEVHDAFKPAFGDGAILMVSKGSEKRAGMIEMVGHTRRPGLHALDENPTLSALLSSEDILGDDIYPLIGAIERWDGEQLTHKFISYPLRLVLKGAFDMKLSDGDTIHLFSKAQIEGLRDPATGEETEQGSRTPPEDMGAQSARFDADKDSDNIDKAMASFLRERSAFVRGAVRNPGPYPVAQDTSLENLIAAAGGLTLEANTANIEITSDMNGTGTHRTRVNFHDDNPQDIMIGPGDAVRVNQKFKKIEDKSVLIIGEVSNPGRYDLLPGDKLSNLLERAGGFTQQAYPEGAIFSRESERKAEELRFRSQAREIKGAIAAALEVDDKDLNAGKIAEARALAGELEKAQGIGRITVEADLAKLKTQPELDALLEAGDRIYIPKRSLNVRVRGEVLSPASLQFREHKDPIDYIYEAGGFSFHADKNRSFVLYPDGSAQPLRVSNWNHSAAFIPPGSTIVVPRDPEPFDFIQSAKDISQILSNLAITAIFIDDVRDSN
ncbi:MAG: SLBB domain-containing protein [Alphaproteobacteria bacterium]|nr:SLBB domain-containing protein [Alphaproteobacteria bacterium]